MSNTHLPSYTTTTPKDLQRFLQQYFIGYVGNSSSVIKFFIDICSLKTNIVYWNKVSNIFERYFSMSNISELTRGLQCLEIAECAIMRNDLGVEGIFPSYIRLTEPNSLLFICEWITEQLLQSFLNHNTLLTFSKEMGKGNHSIPHDLVLPFEQCYKNDTLELHPNLHNPKIYSLDLHTTSFYFTNFSIPFLDKLIINKLTDILFNFGDKLFDLVTKNANITQYDLQQSVSEHNIPKLYAITQSIKQHHAKLISIPQIKTQPLFIELMTLLYYLLPRTLAIENEIKVQTKKSEQFTSTTLDKLVQKKIFTKFQFEYFIDQSLENTYGNNKKEISHQKDLFLKKKVILPALLETTDMDICVDLNSYYIHSRYIFNILINDYQKIRTKLIDLFSLNIAQFLKGKITLKQLLFYNSEITEISIKQFLFKEFPVYYAIIKHPKLIKTAFQSNTNNTNATQIHKYFLPKSKELLPWIQIFDINIRNIFLETSRNMGTFGQLLMMLKGTQAKFSRYLNKK